MPTIYDVPADEMIRKIAEYLKENKAEITPPPWSTFVKTGSHLERLPQTADWWYTRCASILRKINIYGPIGVERLKKEYGGQLGKGNSMEHKRSGGGAIVRNALHQLEKVGLVKTVERKGRIMTASGVSLIGRLATEVKKNLEKRVPELKKYG